MPKKKKAGGIFNESLQSIGCSKGNWWTGEKFVAQVPLFLAEFDRKLPGVSACCIYDNSSNHGSDPPDALRIDKAGFNKFPRGKNRPIMRDGKYDRVTVAVKVGTEQSTTTCESVVQSMFFQNGDRVLTPIGKDDNSKVTPLGAAQQQIAIILLNT